MQSYKTIYSLRIRLALREAGFEPLMEQNNSYKPHLKCWIYAETLEFQQALDQILGSAKRGGRNG